MMFYIKTLLATIIFLSLYGLVFYFYSFFPNENLGILNLIILSPLLIIGLIILFRNRKKRNKNNMIKNLHDFISVLNQSVSRLIKERFKFLLIYTGVIAVLFAWIARINFDTNIQNGLKFHHYLCLYSINTSLIAFSIPILVLMLIGFLKKESR